MAEPPRSSTTSAPAGTCGAHRASSPTQVQRPSTASAKLATGLPGDIVWITPPRSTSALPVGARGANVACSLAHPAAATTSRARTGDRMLRASLAHRLQRLVERLRRAQERLVGAPGTVRVSLQGAAAERAAGLLGVAGHVQVELDRPRGPATGPAVHGQGVEGPLERVERGAARLGRQAGLPAGLLAEGAFEDLGESRSRPRGTAASC